MWKSIGLILHKLEKWGCNEVKKGTKLLQVI